MIVVIFGEAMLCDLLQDDDERIDELLEIVGSLFHLI